MGEWLCSRCKEKAVAYAPYFGLICARCIARHGVNYTVMRRLGE